MMLKGMSDVERWMVCLLRAWHECRYCFQTGRFASSERVGKLVRQIFLGLLDAP